MFVRVRDTSTGHEFDVPDTDPRIGEAFEPVSKPHLEPSPVARRPKHRLRSTRSGASTTKSSSEETTKKEA